MSFGSQTLEKVHSASFQNASAPSPQAFISDYSKDGEEELDQARETPSVVQIDPKSDIGQPPDGGRRAWTMALMGHLMVFNTWGYINSFGIFQAYYVTNLGRTPSEVSWVGSVQTCLVFLVGTFSGRGLDAGYYRPILIAGVTLEIFGIFMTSLSTSYWQLFLAQGVCQGLGDGLMFCPTVALISTYFSTRRTIAISCVASGAATGGIIFPLIAQQLLPKLGFAWTVRVMGFVVLANSVIIIAFIRTRVPPRTSGPLIEWVAFKELPYVLFTAAMFLILWGTYFAYYYTRPFAIAVTHASETTSFSLLLILNGIGVPGRIIPAIIADHYFGAMNLLIPTTLCASLLLYAWAGVGTLNGLYPFVVIFGYFGAGVQGLFPATLASLTDDPQKAGVRIGMVFSIVSVACLTGPPLAGKLVQSMDGGYLGTQMWGGTVLLAGTAVLIGARTAKAGWKLNVRV